MDRWKTLVNGFRRLKAEVGEGDSEGVLREVEAGDGVKSGGVVGVEGLHHRVNQPNVLDAPMAVFVKLFSRGGRRKSGSAGLACRRECRGEPGFSHAHKSACRGAIILLRHIHSRALRRMC